MFTIKQPQTIIFGKFCASKYSYKKKPLLITSKGAKSRGWLEYLNLDESYIFDEVESNPSIEITKKIINEFSNTNFSYIIGLGGGSCLDVAKFVAKEMNVHKILIPTTFGSGSELTRISVLKVEGKKKSFHDDLMFADIALIDSHFLNNTPLNVFKNSLIDSCAQCSEAYDSKISNPYTKFLCKKAFELLEYGVINSDKESIVMGSLYCGLGFGNSSTTLGHALSYVFSNEGYSHGHALAHTTTAAHKFNQSIFYDRFKQLVSRLNFTDITLKQNIEDASDLVLSDRKHLDNNPINVSKSDVVKLLQNICEGKV